MGKRKTNANRYKSGKSKGRIKYPRIQKGNSRVQARIDYFNAMCWQGGGHGRHSADAVGLLWLVGLLDGHPVAGGEMLSALRLYQELRKARYGNQSAQAIDYSPKSSGGEDRRGLPSGASGSERACGLFQRMDNVLRDDMEAWNAIQSLMFDGPPFAVTEFDCPHWVQRFVDRERIAKGHEPECTIAPSWIDENRLKASIRGMSAIVEELGGKRLRHAA